ncbi:hypothetical protein [Sphingomonas sp.]|uniref:hypothetical protein n=1 Tax=Sphingomonas sp. TaxID=28214 RepID=UPI003CC57C40
MSKMDDSAIGRIRALGKDGRVPSFAWLRGSFAVQKSADVYKSLNYGKTVIETEDQLNQYLYSYGPMVQSQWTYASKFLSLLSIDSATRWIDYGCGQGLAGLFLYEALGPTLFNQVSDVILVEPSAMALCRAKAIYKALAPRSAVDGIRKSFSDLEKDELEREGARSTLHVFSNVLDINGYNHLKLLGDRLSPGKHVIIAVGNDRDFDGGSPNLQKLKTAVEHPKMASRITVASSTLEQFKCDNRSEPAIVWHCELEVRDG